MTRPEDLGAIPHPDGSTLFRLWAPRAKTVELCLDNQRLPMQQHPRGYFELATQTQPGARYAFSLDNGPERPDPASRHQPDGVHARSEVVDPRFPWTDQSWTGLPLRRHLFYELHVGTFTLDGTFDAVIPRLDALKDLGVTTVELMPIAQFPGSRNWGYDGVDPYAAQSSYGGPAALKRLVNAAHARGLAVCLDVVYNHLGPEGNYLDAFGPYFTDRYKTPWGRALNFDGEHSDEVRRFFIGSALYWVTDCHIDALRLDAVHAIVDPSPIPFIRDLTDAIHARAELLRRHIHLIAESAANDARLITPSDRNGLGADAQWNDDFHHALRTVLTGDTSGYYSSYGRLWHLRKALTDGFVYTGEHSDFHKRRHGSPSRHIPAERFVVFNQNHDHVGNRMLGERLGMLIPFEKLQLAAAATILSPFLPLFFMGEEYSDPSPFLYFVSHSDKQLIEAVRNGRAEEFASFKFQGEAHDPQSEATFRASKLNWDARTIGDRAALLAFYKELIRLRRGTPALSHLSKESLEATADEAAHTLTIHRWAPSADPGSRSEAFIAFNFSDGTADINAPSDGAPWRIALDSGDNHWRQPAVSDQEPPVRAVRERFAVKPLSVAVLLRGTSAPGA